MYVREEAFLVLDVRTHFDAEDQVISGWKDILRTIFVKDPRGQPPAGDPLVSKARLLSADREPVNLQVWKENGHLDDVGAMAAADVENGFELPEILVAKQDLAHLGLFQMDIVVLGRMPPRIQIGGGHGKTRSYGLERTERQVFHLRGHTRQDEGVNLLHLVGISIAFVSLPALMNPAQECRHLHWLADNDESLRLTGFHDRAPEIQSRLRRQRLIAEVLGAHFEISRGLLMVFETHAALFPEWPIDDDRPARRRLLPMNSVAHLKAIGDGIIAGTVITEGCGGR